MGTWVQKIILWICGQNYFLKCTTHEYLLDNMDHFGIQNFVHVAWYLVSNFNIHLTFRVVDFYLLTKPIEHYWIEPLVLYCFEIQILRTVSWQFWQHLIHGCLQKASLAHAEPTESDLAFQIVMWCSPSGDEQGFSLPNCGVETGKVKIIQRYLFQMDLRCPPGRVEELIGDIELNTSLVELGLLAGVAHRGHHHLPHHHRHRVRLLHTLHVVKRDIFQLFWGGSPASPICLSWAASRFLHPSSCLSCPHNLSCPSSSHQSPPCCPSLWWRIKRLATIKQECKRV